MLDVSIIIVNWNACDVLRDCLCSIAEQTKKLSYEVIVVDNNSTDCSVAMVEKEFPDVILLANKENRGFAAANNQGIERSSGRYVLLLNPDTVILDQAIEKSVSFADTQPDGGVIGVKTVRGDHTLVRNCFQYASLLNMSITMSGLHLIFPENRLWGRERMTWWDYETVRTVDVVAGCYMLVRREVIQDVGGMDEQFFMYGEEMDWCRRITRAGWKIYYQPDASIIHYGGMSAAQNPFGMQQEQRKSYLLYFRKHHGCCSVFFAQGLMFCGGIFRLAYWSIRKLISRGESRRIADEKIRKVRIIYFGRSGN